MRIIRNPLIVGLLLIVSALAFVSCNTAISPSDDSTDSSTTEPVTQDDTGFLTAEDPPRGLLRSSWSTDFSQRTVEWSEIMSGGPPKDGIPAVDEPTYESIDAAATWITDRDPVILYENNGDARAYPLAILMWHEIVNDEVGGKPISVTFCPLCNASIVFDREFDGQILDFGTTGLLRNSDLVMYDRQSETWWQQFLGQGIVGEHAGEQLTFLASQVISFGDFRQQYPDSDVLARPTEPRSYGSNPYTNYDSTSGRPFLFSGELDTRLDSTERVVGVDLDGDTMAYPFIALAEAQVINDTIADNPIVVFHKSGTASALDTGQISEGRDVGSAAVYSRVLGDQTLTFKPGEDGTYIDAETGTIWSIFGEAVDGELTGQQLEQTLAFDHFWFAWSAFHPDTRLYKEN